MEHYNPNLAELPNHKHYPACRGRKKAIEDNCQVLFMFTLGAGLIFGLLTLFGIRFSVISWLPMLLGERNDLLPFFVQLLTIIFIVVLSGLNCGKHKFCGVILLGIYAFMAVFGFINTKDNLADYITCSLGALGVVCSIVSVKDYTDWKQLVETEGFPHFDIKVTESNENPNYQPQHTGAGASPNMSPVTPAVPLQFTGQDVELDMPELPSLSQIKAYRSKSDSDAEFVQEDGKYCCISESPIKII